MTMTVQEAEVLFSARGMAEVAAASVKAGKHLDRLSGAASHAMRAVSRLGSAGVSALRGLGSAASGVASKVAGIAGKAAMFGLPAAGAAGVAMVKLAADAESLNTQFRVLIGSAQGANALLAEIDQFAATTPLQKMDIAQAARSLLAFGSDADTVVSELRMLGDIAAGTGQPLGELAELYGKAQVQGRLFAEDINQLTGRGVPVIQALAKEFGVAEADIRQIVSEGKVGFPELQRALAGMTGEGGKFSGLMAELSQTTAGRFSTLVDNAKLFGTQLGTVLLPYANEFLDWAMRSIPAVDGIAAAFRNVIETGRAWYNAVSNWLQDVGVITGVVVADWDTLWAGLWEDTKSYAQAAFEWMVANSKIMIQNVAAIISDLPQILKTQATNAMEATKFALGLSDAATLRDPLANVSLKEFTAFAAPELSDDTMSVMRDIADELELSRAQRAADRTAVPEVVRTVVAPDQAFVSAQRTAAAAGDVVAQQQVQRASASAVFNRLQESLANKTLAVQQDQLGVAQEQLAQQVNMAATLGQIAGGIPIVLG